MGLGMAGQPGYGDELEQSGTDTIESLTATVSTEDLPLEREAEQFGIAETEKARYVIDMRALNRQYQQGSLTRTEYIAAKRELIERLK